MLCNRKRNKILIKGNFSNRNMPWNLYDKKNSFEFNWFRAVLPVIPSVIWRQQQTIWNKRLWSLFLIRSLCFWSRKSSWDYLFEVGRQLWTTIKEIKKHTGNSWDKILLLILSNESGFSLWHLAGSFGHCWILDWIRMNILMLDTRNVEQTKYVRMYTWRIYSSRDLDTLLHKLKVNCTVLYTELNWISIGRMLLYIHSQQRIEKCENCS